MLEDGNADDKSLHAGLPVVDGEKWLCNLWVWDPKIKFDRGLDVIGDRSALLTQGSTILIYV